MLGCRLAEAVGDFDAVWSPFCRVLEDCRKSVVACFSTISSGTDPGVGIYRTTPKQVRIDDFVDPKVCPLVCVALIITHEEQVASGG